ncbi:MAG TPA: M14 family metallopeptidase [Ideonella sp.]|nr:M14 family metallopeptidase [Ideonella sp.]
MKLNTIAAAALLAALSAGTGHAAEPAAATATQPADARAARALQALEAEQRVDNIYKLYVPNQTLARRALISLHNQLMEAHLDEGYLIVQLDARDKQRLEGMGFTAERATDWLRERNQRLERLKANGGASLLGRHARPGPGAESIPDFACFETVEETADAARALVGRYPRLASLADIGDSWEKTQDDGGYDLQVLKLTNDRIAGPKPILFVDSAIHAREYATAPLMLDFARLLTKGYGNNADATWILDHHEIHLLLQTNPDGRKRAEAGALWRKNTDTYCTAGAPLALQGVDLNRNFSYSWNSTGGVGSSGAKCSETYRGPSASSEPETQAVENYIRSLWPDRRGPGLDDPAPADTSGIHLDIHSFAQLVLWPWGVREAPAPNGPALQALGRRFAYFNNYTPQQSIGLYPTDGTSDSPSYGELGVAAFTFEIGSAFFESCSTYKSTVRPDNLPALLYAAKMVRTPYLTAGGPDVTEVGLGKDAAGGGVAAGTRVPLRASATDLRFNNSNGTEPTQNIAAAEIYIDTPPWLAGAVPRALQAVDGAFDAKTETVGGVIRTDGLAKGRHLVYVRARDASNTWGPFSATFLVIR